MKLRRQSTALLVAISVFALLCLGGQEESQLARAQCREVPNGTRIEQVHISSTLLRYPLISLKRQSSHVDIRSICCFSGLLYRVRCSKQRLKKLCKHNALLCRASAPVVALLLEGCGRARCLTGRAMRRVRRSRTGM